MRRKTIILLLATPLAIAGCTTMDAQIRSSGAMGSVDATYVNTAYQLVQLDTQAGKLAATKASDPRVQTLAATLMTQANAFTPGLQSVMKVEGIQPPTALPSDEAAQIATLGGLSGTAFDHQFVADELAIHQRAVIALKKEDAETKDGALRTQVETEMPAVLTNLNTLKGLSSEYTGKAQG